MNRLSLIIQLKNPIKNEKKLNYFTIFGDYTKYLFYDYRQRKPET